MKAFWGYYKIGLAHFFKYRFNVLFNFVMGIFPLYIRVCIWTNVYSNNKIIENYNKSNIVSYFFLVFIIEMLIDSEVIGKEIANEIRDGSILNFLIKPVNYLCMKVGKILGYKIGNLLVVSIPICFLFILGKQQTVFCNIRSVLVFIISLVLAFVLNLFINIFLGVLTLKYEEIGSGFDLLNVIRKIMSGSLIPLSFLGDNIGRIFSCFPFKYTLSTPIEALLNTEKGNIIQSSIIQIFWIGFIAVLIRNIWKYNIKKYGAYGI